MSTSLGYRTYLFVLPNADNNFQMIIVNQSCKQFVHCTCLADRVLFIENKFVNFTLWYDEKKGVKEQLWISRREKKNA